MAKIYKHIRIRLASPEEIRSWSYGEVKKHETINYRTLKPEVDGLFCEKIFGPQKDYQCLCGKSKRTQDIGTICDKCGVEITEAKVRRERMGHIELAAPVVHTWYFKNTPSKLATLLDIKTKHLEEIIYLASYIVIDPGDIKDEEKKPMLIKKQILSESEYSRLNEEHHNRFKALTGAEAIKKLLQELDLEKEVKILRKKLKTVSKQKRDHVIKRLEVVESFNNSDNKPEWMVLDVLPVIPPDIRPMVQLDGGRFATTDLNDLYRRILNRNNRLKKQYEQNAPHLITKNEKRMLQEAVDALIDNSKRGKKTVVEKNRHLKSLSDMLRGKQGRFRQNLLGKRVDYSGRSVIVVGPDLKMYQCGIPKEMALTLFKPFVMRELVKDGKMTINNARNMIDRLDDKVWGILEEVIREHPVLLNRAPTLHRLGIQAFEPKLIEGKAIRLHPLVTTAFNADFDGDQMAVHVPLSYEAQSEARLLMLASNNILNPKDGKPVVTPSQDMVLGNYYLTMEKAHSFVEETIVTEIAGKYTKNSSFKINDRIKKGDKLCSVLTNGVTKEIKSPYDGVLLKVEFNDDAVLDDDKELFIIGVDKIDDKQSNEGHVYLDYNEAYLAYKNEEITLHTRIAILPKSIGKTFNKEKMSSFLVTTLGKMIFNRILPENFPYLNEASEYNLTKETPMKYFVPRGIDIKKYLYETQLVEPFKKKFLSRIIAEVFKQFKITKTSEMLDLLKDLGFKYSTIAGITISASDVTVYKGKKAIIDAADKRVYEIKDAFDSGIVTDDERYTLVKKEWTNARAEILKGLMRSLDKSNHIYMMQDSGARGNTSNFLQLAGMRGLMNNPAGEVIEVPVKASFLEGLSVSEFFNSTHGARKGSTDTALKTAESGYLTRRLVDVSQDVIVSESDCKTEKGIMVEDIVADDGKVIVELYDRIIGRFASRNIYAPKTNKLIIGRNEMISNDTAKDIIDLGITRVPIRSVFTCNSSSGVCIKCYGRNLATNNIVEIGEAVGTIAAQSIGEPGTQLTMRTFHTGGVASTTDITQGLPRIQELFEVRPPKGKAAIAEKNGYIVSIEKAPKINQIEITIRENIGGKLEDKKYNIDGNSEILVDIRDEVHAGQKLTKGSIAPKELLRVSTAEEVQKYILKEVQAVYRAQGVEIGDKHIEIIIRQMMRKVQILNEGDTTLLPGSEITLAEFAEENKKTFASGGRFAIAKPVLNGITKASLRSESFLSAASFQETTRILTDAAIKGKIDTLQGLKENVIIGGLIPAGTGILKHRLGSFVYPKCIDEDDDDKLAEEIRYDKPITEEVRFDDDESDVEFE